MWVFETPHFRHLHWRSNPKGKGAVLKTASSVRKGVWDFKIPFLRHLWSCNPNQVRKLFAKQLVGMSKSRGGSNPPNSASRFNGAMPELANGLAWKARVVKHICDRDAVAPPFRCCLWSSSKTPRCDRGNRWGRTSKTTQFQYGCVAQWLERYLHMVCVGSSILSTSTISDSDWRSW